MVRKWGISWTSLEAQTVKNLPAMQVDPKFDSRVRKIPWRGEWLPTPVFLPGEFQGQRSLAGHSPRYHKESDMSEAIDHTCTQITVESILLYLRASETANLSKLRFAGLGVFKTVLLPQTKVLLKLPQKHSEN